MLLQNRHRRMSMKKEQEDIDLEKYPYLKKYLDESNQKYDLDSDEDLFSLFNVILKRINKKHGLELENNKTD